MSNYLIRGNDKLTHGVVCAVIALLASSISLGLGGIVYVSLIEGVMCAMAAGLGKEAGDAMNGGAWDWGDLAADMAGAVAGVGVCWGLFWLCALV